MSHNQNKKEHEVDDPLRTSYDEVDEFAALKDELNFGDEEDSDEDYGESPTSDVSPSALNQAILLSLQHNSSGQSNPFDEEEDETMSDNVAPVPGNSEDGTSSSNTNQGGEMNQRQPIITNLNNRPIAEDFRYKNYGLPPKKRYTNSKKRKRVADPNDPTLPLLPHEKNIKKKKSEIEEFLECGEDIHDLGTKVVNAYINSSSRGPITSFSDDEGDDEERFNETGDDGIIYHEATPVYDRIILTQANTAENNSENIKPLDFDPLHYGQREGGSDQSEKTGEDDQNIVSLSQRRRRKKKKSSSSSLSTPSRTTTTTTTTQDNFTIDSNVTTPISSPVEIPSSPEQVQRAQVLHPNSPTGGYIGDEEYHMMMNNPEDFQNEPMLIAFEDDEPSSSDFDSPGVNLLDDEEIVFRNDRRGVDDRVICTGTTRSNDTGETLDLSKSFQDSPLILHHELNNVRSNLKIVRESATKNLKSNSVMSYERVPMDATGTSTSSSHMISNSFYFNPYLRAIYSTTQHIDPMSMYGIYWESEKFTKKVIADDFRNDEFLVQNGSFSSDLKVVFAFEKLMCGTSQPLIHWGVECSNPKCKKKDFLGPKYSCVTCKKERLDRIHHHHQEEEEPNSSSFTKGFSTDTIFSYDVCTSCFKNRIEFHSKEHEFRRIDHMSIESEVLEAQRLIDYFESQHCPTLVYNMVIYKSRLIHKQSVLKKKEGERVLMEIRRKLDEKKKFILELLATKELMTEKEELLKMKLEGVDGSIQRMKEMMNKVPKLEGEEEIEEEDIEDEGEVEEEDNDEDMFV